MVHVMGLFTALCFFLLDGECHFIQRFVSVAFCSVYVCTHLHIGESFSNLSILVSETFRPFSAEWKVQTIANTYLDSVKLSLCNGV